MKWFKFYGQDWLTDPKIISMKIEDRLCFLTLLCLASASETGLIKDCTEDIVIRLSGLDDNVYDTDNEYTRAQGCFERLKMKQMITYDNGGCVTIVNFNKRQGQNLTNYERVKRYRERKKSAKNIDKLKKSRVINDNIDDNNNDNARIDKNRIDKNIYVGDTNLEEKLTKQLMKYEYDDDVREIRKKSKISKEQNNQLIAIGCLWVDLVSKSLSLKKEEVPIKNIYYPIRACYEREKFTYEDFKSLFNFFLNGSLKDEDKISFDLCMSEKYVAKYKIAKKGRKETFAGISNEIKL